MSVEVGFEPVRHLGLVERLEAELLLACGTARDRGGWGYSEGLGYVWDRIKGSKYFRVYS